MLSRHYDKIAYEVPDIFQEDFQLYVSCGIYHLHWNEKVDINDEVLQMAQEFRRMCFFLYMERLKNAEK
jgi:hypothetical protein